MLRTREKASGRAKKKGSARVRVLKWASAREKANSEALLAGFASRFQSRLKLAVILCLRL